MRIRYTTTHQTDIRYFNGHFSFQLCHNFDTAGSYNISVEVSNALSHLSQWVFVSVQYPVTKVIVMATNTVLGSESEISVIVTGSTNVAVEIEFGEVESIRLEGLDLDQHLQVKCFARKSFNWFP